MPPFVAVTRAWVFVQRPARAMVSLRHLTGRNGTVSVIVSKGKKHLGQAGLRARTALPLRSALRALEYKTGLETDTRSHLRTHPEPCVGVNVPTTPKTLGTGDTSRVDSLYE